MHTQSTSYWSQSYSESLREDPCPQRKKDVGQTCLPERPHMCCTTRVGLRDLCKGAAEFALHDVDATAGGLPLICSLSLSLSLSFSLSIQGSLSQATTYPLAIRDSSPAPYIPPPLPIFLPRSLDSSPDPYIPPPLPIFLPRSLDSFPDPYIPPPLPIFLPRSLLSHTHTHTHAVVNQCKTSKV